jgi:prepilin-type N-terminal cleavage/methylation domain-containing protein
VKRRSNSGFTLLEALLVIAISVVVAAIALPVFTRYVNNYRLIAAVSAVTGAIQTTRFQAILHGCQYQLVLTSSTMSYQVYTEAPQPPATACLSTFTTVMPGTTAPAGAVPILSSGPITMSGTSFTFTFSSNGTLTEVASPAGTGLELTNSLKSTYIYVSGVGDVTTCQPTSLCTCSATTPTVCD